MPDEAKENLQQLWKKQGEVARQAQMGATAVNVGSVGLVAAQIPEFFSKDRGAKSKWRLPLFLASSASIVVGVVINWVKGNEAEQMREANLMLEHNQSMAQPGQWSQKMAAEQNSSPGIMK